MWVPKAWVHNCGRAASTRASGVRVLKHLGVLVAKPTGPKGLSFGADAHGASDDCGGAASNVVWQVATVGAWRSQALEKLGQFILGRAALAPSLKKAPRTCQEWVRQVGLAMSDLR